MRAWEAQVAVAVLTLRTLHLQVPEPSPARSLCVPLERSGGEARWMEGGGCRQWESPPRRAAPRELPALGANGKTPLFA